MAVSDQRARNDRAEQIRKPFDKDFPDRRFTLVPDNPDTDSLGSLYETFPPGEARRIASWLTLVFTPPYDSRLNMAETGIDARSRQCLDRRIPDRATLERRAAAWREEHNAGKAKPKRRFTTARERIRLKSPYPGI